MKSLLALLVVFAGSTALAETVGTTKDVLTCTVPLEEGTPVISMSLSVTYDTSNDFVILTVNDKNEPFRMFAQVDKGSVESSLSEGSLVVFLLQEDVEQDSGVLRNAGLMVVNKDDTGNLSGLLSAHGHLYPLSCSM